MSTMRIAILVRHHLYIESAPWYFSQCVLSQMSRTRKLCLKGKPTIIDKSISATITAALYGSGITLYNGMIFPVHRDYRKKNANTRTARGGACNQCKRQQYPIQCDRQWVYAYLISRIQLTNTVIMAKIRNYDMWHLLITTLKYFN